MIAQNHFQSDEKSRWQSYLTVAAVACLPIGLIWDISWHISIGRDTFWAPAHLVIQLGGIIPALLFAYQSAKVTFRGTPEEKGASIHFWGARGSLGAWVTIWGAVAMVTSAPFDDWWHNTYGLDVKIASPPHSLLGLGMFAVALGVLLFVLSGQNRASLPAQNKTAWLFTIAAGLLITMLSVYATEFTWPNRQHNANYYKVVCWVYPFLLAASARASKLRWAASIVAAIYMGIMLGLIWFLPLFAAHPKLAPIYNPVTHMVPPAFPMLLILPAVIIDIFLWVTEKKYNVPSAGPWTQKFLKDSLLAIAVGPVFLLLVLAVQWYFAQFLLSPAANNWFFSGNRHWPYYVHLDHWRYQFWDLDRDPLTIRSLVAAGVFAMISARLGLICGQWMLRVKR